MIVESVKYSHKIADIFVIKEASNVGWERVVAEAE